MTKAAIVLLALALHGNPGLAQEPLSEAEQDALTALTEEHSTTYELIDSWFEKRPIQYYDFGPSPVDAGTLYRVRGAGEIVTTVPGLDDYTTLRQVLEVQVTGAGVDPASVRSHTEVSRLIARGDARLVATGLILNVLVVPAGSTLERDPEARPLRVAWYRGRPITYFDFGPTRPATTPLIAFGMIGADGSIEIVQGTNVARVPGVAGCRPSCIPLRLFATSCAYYSADMPNFCPRRPAPVPVLMRAPVPLCDAVLAVIGARSQADKGSRSHVRE